MADLADLLARRQAVLQSALGLGGAFGHPVARGDVGEANWIDTLEKFLPGRYQVSRGAFLIDSNGAESSEMDVVVHDNYFHPQVFEAADRKYIPAESVYAVFEAKQELTRDYLLTASHKAREARTLHRTSVPFMDGKGRSDARPPQRILSGILASRSGWNPPLGEALEGVLREVEPEARVDLGLAVRDGAFEFRQAETDDAPRLELARPEHGLMFFLTRLYTRLQEVGSVPAIDLIAYDRTAQGE